MKGSRGRGTFEGFVQGPRCAVLFPAAPASLSWSHDAQLLVPVQLGCDAGCRARRRWPPHLLEPVTGNGVQLRAGQREREESRLLT